MSAQAASAPQLDPPSAVGRRTAPVDQGSVRLDRQSVEAIAQRLAQLLGDRAGEREPAGRTAEDRLLSAEEVAERWGVERSWVYRHADRLGAIRLGDGPRPRLRFDPQLLRHHLGRTTGPSQPRRPCNRGASARIRSHAAPLLAIHRRVELSSDEQAKNRPDGAQTPPATAPKMRPSAR